MMGRRALRKELIERRISEVLELENELGKVRSAQNNLGFIILDKPIRHGWYRSYKLRIDISRTKEVKVYQEILDAVKVEIWGREKKYADRNWKEYFSKAKYVYQRPGIKFLNAKEHKELSVKAKRHFAFRNRSNNRVREKIYFCTLPLYFFVPLYEKAYITERRVIDADLERRQQELLEILSKPIYRRLSIYYNYKYRCWQNPNKSQRRKTKEALNGINIERKDDIYLELYSTGFKDTW